MTDCIGSDDVTQQPPIFVRALWGNPSVVTYDKALHDIQQRSTRLPDWCELRTVVYGNDNLEFLEHFDGHGRLICLMEILPVAYRIWGADRPLVQSKWRPGTYQQGVCMWWHKLDAMLVAMQADPPAEEIIWLDHDTKLIKEPDDALFELLRAGPPLQGDECVWKAYRCPWRRGTRLERWSYHGGCYYIRGQEILTQAIEIHAKELYQYSDETALSWVADKILTGQQCVNPVLYKCRKTRKEYREVESYFQEGDVFHWKTVRDRLKQEVRE